MRIRLFDALTPDVQRRCGEFFRYESRTKKYRKRKIAEKDGGKEAVPEPKRRVRQKISRDTGVFQDDSRVFEQPMLEDCRYPELEKVEVLSDGNCLFRSLSYVLNWQVEAHIDLRQRLVDWMLENETEFKRQDQDHNQFVGEMQKVKQPGIWAGFDCILAFSLMFSKPVAVISTVGGVQFTHVISTEGGVQFTYKGKAILMEDIQLVFVEYNREARHYSPLELKATTKPELFYRELFRKYSMHARAVDLTQCVAEPVEISVNPHPMVVRPDETELSQHIDAFWCMYADSIFPYVDTPDVIHCFVLLMMVFQFYGNNFKAYLDRGSERLLTAFEDFNSALIDLPDLTKEGVRVFKLSLYELVKKSNFHEVTPPFSGDLHYMAMAASAFLKINLFKNYIESRANKSPIIDAATTLPMLLRADSGFFYSHVFAKAEKNPAEYTEVTLLLLARLVQKSKESHKRNVASVFTEAGGKSLRNFLVQVSPYNFYFYCLIDRLLSGQYKVSDFEFCSLITQGYFSKAQLKYFFFANPEAQDDSGQIKECYLKKYFAEKNKRKVLNEYLLTLKNTCFEPGTFLWLSVQEWRRQRFGGVSAYRQTGFFQSQPENTDRVTAAKSAAWKC